jgi:hypothetical protein
LFTPLILALTLTLSIHSSPRRLASCRHHPRSLQSCCRPPCLRIATTILLPAIRLNNGGDRHPRRKITAWAIQPNVRSTSGRLHGARMTTIWTKNRGTKLLRAAGNPAHGVWKLQAPDRRYLRTNPLLHPHRASKPRSPAAHSSSRWRTIIALMTGAPVNRWPPSPHPLSTANVR